MRRGAGSRDPFTGGERDPRAAPPLGRFAPRKGPGRPLHPGERGRQTAAPVASEPDIGLFPTFR